MRSWDYVKRMKIKSSDVSPRTFMVVKSPQADSDLNRKDKK
jgi:hypothetical protein